jgi:hypothetical protein
LLLGACALFLPAFGATSIVLEREQETLDALRTTLIRPFGIVLGKLINTLGFFLLLILAVMPVLSTVFFLVGLDWVEFAQALTIVLMSALSFAMVGILVSAIFRRMLVAIIAAYVGVWLNFFGSFFFGLFAWIVMNFLSVLLPYSLTRPGGMGYVNPGGWSSLTALMMIGMGQISWVHFAGVMLYQLCFTGLCGLLALAVLQRAPAPPKIESSKPIDDPEILRQRRRRFPYYLIDPLARKKLVEDGRNPMLVRELRWGLMNRGTFMARTFLASFVVWLVAAFPAATDINLSALRGWFLFQMVGIVVLAPAFLANVLTKEYELGNIDMLRMTLLRPRDIILGKLVAGGSVVLPLFLSSVATSVSLLITDAYRWDLLLVGYTTSLLCLILSVCLGLFASLLTRRSSTALVLTYLLVCFVFASSVLVWDIAPFWARVLGSPIVTFAMVSTNARIRMGFPLSWMMNIAVYSCVCVTLVLSSIGLFHRYRERDE